MKSKKAGDYLTQQNKEWSAGYYAASAGQAFDSGQSIYWQNGFVAYSEEEEALDVSERRPC